MRDGFTYIKCFIFFSYIAAVFSTRDVILVKPLAQPIRRIGFDFNNNIWPEPPLVHDGYDYKPVPGSGQSISAKRRSEYTDRLASVIANDPLALRTIDSYDLGNKLNSRTPSLSRKYYTESILSANPPYFRRNLARDSIVIPDIKMSKCADRKAFVVDYNGFVHTLPRIVSTETQKTGEIFKREHDDEFDCDLDPSDFLLTPNDNVKIETTTNDGLTNDFKNKKTINFLNLPLVQTVNLELDDDQKNVPIHKNDEVFYSTPAHVKTRKFNF